MHGSRSMVSAVALAFAAFGGASAAHAETVMQQCGQQYQAAKAGGTLNGMTWNQFRTDCAAKLKTQPASASMPAPAVPAAPAPAPAPIPTANPLSPAPVTTAAGTAKPAESPGRIAFVARERECGSEWRANKVTLVAQTPGITWPKYLSECNTRLKAAGK